MRRLILNALWVVYLATCLSLLFIAPASAYIDPGSGSIIFQAVVGGALAVGVGIKVFWGRIVSFIRRKR